MTGNIRFLKVLAWAGVCLVAGAVFASVVLHLTNEELSERADRIVHGVVTSVEYRWNEGKTAIYTLTTIRVEEFVKGKGAEREIVIRQIGGMDGEIKMLTPGDAVFEKDQEVVVFVRKADDEAVHFMVGMKQGKFDVVRKQDGGKFVTRDFQGMSVAKFAGDGMPMVYSAAPEPKEVLLDEFLNEIKGYLETKK